MNIIKLAYDNNYYTNEQDLLIEGVKYTHERNLELNEVIYFIQEFNKYNFNKHLTIEEIATAALCSMNEEIAQDILNELNHYEDSPLESIKELIEDNYIYDVMDLTSYYLTSEEMKEITEEIARNNGFKIGRAGYSPWASYIARNEMDNDYIEDFYNGSNFYSIEWISKDEIISGVYLKDEEDLKEYVKDFYGLEDFYLVKNEESNYMSIKKVKEVNNVSYEIINERAL